MDHNFPDDEYSSEEEMEESRGFTSYTPDAVGPAHPAPICESKTLSWTRGPALEEREVVGPFTGLSNVQIEAILRINQRHNQFLWNGARAGFLLGDGTGVGKGRIIAGLINIEYHKGVRKALWISSSWDLTLDAEKDLTAVGCPLDLIPFEDIRSKRKNKKNVEEVPGVYFCTYYSLAGSKSSIKVEEIVALLGTDFNGIVALDESHRAKNYREDGQSSRIGKLIVQLQEKLTAAKVLYISATGASDLDHLEYMPRLGLWGGTESEFKTAKSFIETIKKRGLGATELLSLELKASGRYLARNLSYEGISFEQKFVDLTPEFEEMYILSTKIWMKLIDALKAHPKPRLASVSFWTRQQQYFSALIVKSKVALVGDLAREETEKGKSVIIGIQKTGESAFKSALHNDAEASTTLLNIVQKCMVSLGITGNPITRHVDESSSGSDTEHEHSSDTESAVTSSSLSSTSSSSSSCKEETKKIKLDDNQKTIHELVEELARMRHSNILDELTDLCGGPCNVAEITGRSYRPVLVDGKTTTQRVRRSAQFKNSINNQERRLFQCGSKQVAIISDAGSTGVSLHCDANYAPIRQRLQMIVELPWSAEKVMQQLGRSNRSNQSIKPNFIVVLSPVPGELRFVSTITQRLQIMGAIINANKNANSIGINCQFGNDKKISQKALSQLIQNVEEDSCDHFSSEEAMFLKVQFLKLGISKLDEEGDSKLKSQTNQLQKFMNRMLLLPLHYQQKILIELNNFYDETFNYMKRHRKLDTGILEFKNVVGSTVVLRKSTIFQKGHVNLSLHEISNDRGCPWERALMYISKFTNPEVQPILGLTIGGKVLLALPLRLQQPNEIRKYDILRPSCGKTQMEFTRQKIKDLGYREIDASDRTMYESKWTYEYEGSLGTPCLHKLRNGYCGRNGCQYGIRDKIFTILCGTLHEIWDNVEDIIGMKPVPAKFTLEDKACIFGLIIPQDSTAAIYDYLTSEFGGALSD